MSTPPAGPASPPWWALLPPAEAQVTCGEQAHRLRWAEGLLTAVDHPGAEEELVLAALGGDRSECVDLVEWWGSRGDDLEVLAVGPRSAAGPRQTAWHGRSLRSSEPCSRRRAA